MTELLGCVETQNETCGLSVSIDQYSNSTSFSEPDDIIKDEKISVPNGSIVLLTDGRLGNQFFQYAAAYALSKKTESKLYLFVPDCAACFLKESDPAQDVTYYLTRFNLAEDTIIIPIKEEALQFIKTLYPSYPYQYKDFGKLTPPSAQALNAKYISAEQQLIEAAQTKNDKILVMAYFFESQRYFDKFSKGILSQYTISNFDISNIKEILEQVSLDNSVCMNVRRKEMIKEPYLYIPIDYQEQAMKFIEAEKLVDNPRYFVISDDIALVKEELKAYNGIEYIEGIKSLEALYILSHCKNNIMTVSSFSWWGSYLNNAAGFTIIPCNYHDLFKFKGITYKIQFSTDGANKCNYSPYTHTSYIKQYKYASGQNMVKYETNKQNKIIKKHIW